MTLAGEIMRFTSRRGTSHLPDEILDSENQKSTTYQTEMKTIFKNDLQYVHPSQ